MQKISHIPALFALLLATTLAACAPTAAPPTADAAPQASLLAPAPQPRLGFEDFVQPNL